MTKATAEPLAAQRTGTVYALIDPRDKAERYIGATVQTPKQRLAGHVNGTRTAPPVRKWIDELKSQGLAPEIVPIAELPEAELAARETAEITKRIVAGQSLLNQSATARGRKALERLVAAEQQASKRNAWAHLAYAVRGVLGGPLSPGAPGLLPPCRSVQSYWQHQLPQRLAELDSRRPKSDEEYRIWDRLREVQKQTEQHLVAEVSSAWVDARSHWNEDTNAHHKHLLHAAIARLWPDHGAFACYVALLPWYLIAVNPWRQLVADAGLHLSDEAFIKWVSDDPNVRQALVALADGAGTLAKLDHYDHIPPGMHRHQAGTLLATVVVAHAGLEVPRSIRAEITDCLLEFARAEAITQPMIELLETLAPDYLNRVLGPDIAAEIDGDLGLAIGTSAKVAARLERRIGGPTERLERVVKRASGRIEVQPVPSYDRWWTARVQLPMRAICGALVAAGMAPPPSGKSRDQYVAESRTAWSARLEWAECDEDVFQRLAGSYAYADELVREWKDRQHAA